MALRQVLFSDVNRTACIPMSPNSVVANVWHPRDWNDTEAILRVGLTADISGPLWI
jgi:hypothetical protein